MGTPKTERSAHEEIKEAAVAVSDEEFADLIGPLGPFDNQETLAVAVSGGPDSMALLRLVHAWSLKNGYRLVGLTVDHQLRSESTSEAARVGQWLHGLAIEHHTLRWDQGGVVGQLDASPQAAAREARFDLMTGWCRDHQVNKLLLAHHADDQIETFMQRLIRGSGVDGLAAMHEKTTRQRVDLLRPLLTRTKNDLIATCLDRNQAWLDDPSNSNETFSRVRVRNLLKALDREGFDSRRLLNTVGHMQRAKVAIDTAVIELMESCVTDVAPNAKVIMISPLLEAPDEVGMRCLSRCLAEVAGSPYPPRFDSLVNVYQTLGTAAWTDRTLHGCQLRVADGDLGLTPEGRKSQNSG